MARSAQTRRGVAALFLCGFVLHAGAATEAQETAQSSPGFRAAVQALSDRIGVPALSVAVFGRGRLLASETVGLADVRTRRSAAADSLFRIGSISKLLTASAALRLVDAGRLDLDAPLSRYVPVAPPDKAQITPRQLAGHLSGFAHYGRDDYISTIHYTDVTQVLPRLLAQPLVARPGTRYSYSSYGYNVLGAILRSVVGQPFAQVIREQVTAPLGMSHTVVDEPLPSRVTLYSKDGDTLQPAAPSDLSDRWPSGGYVSTAEDLARFGVHAVNAPYLSERTRTLLSTTQRDASGKDTIVGIGWRVARDAQGRTYLHHGGESLGGRGFILTYPHRDVAIAMLTNVSFAAFGEREALELLEPFNP